MDLAVVARIEAQHTSADAGGLTIVLAMPTPAAAGSSERGNRLNGPPPTVPGR